ncbi:MAG: class E sortase [Bacillota bacterium]|nr:class E sortase [Bacillota bacterium]
MDRGLLLAGALLLFTPLWLNLYTYLAQHWAQHPLVAMASDGEDPALRGMDEIPHSQEGAAFAPPFLLEIPRLQLKVMVWEGVTLDVLRKGPGHYPQTPLPGQGGNLAIAGHRTTYGAPFRRLGELVPGDVILIGKDGQSFRYIVEKSWVVLPTDLSPLDPTDVPSLTLTTCDPPGSAAYRLIIRAIAENR